MDTNYVIIHEDPPPFDPKQWIRKGKIFPSNPSTFPDLESYCERNIACIIKTLGSRHKNDEYLEAEDINDD